MTLQHAGTFDAKLPTRRGETQSLSDHHLSRRTDNVASYLLFKTAPPATMGKFQITRFSHAKVSCLPCLAIAVRWEQRSNAGTGPRFLPPAVAQTSLKGSSNVPTYRLGGLHFVRWGWGSRKPGTKKLKESLKGKRWRRPKHRPMTEDRWEVCCEKEQRGPVIWPYAVEPSV